MMETALTRSRTSVRQLPLQKKVSFQEYFFLFLNNRKNLKFFFQKSARGREVKGYNFKNATMTIRSMHQSLVQNLRLYRKVNSLKFFDFAFIDLFFR